MSKIKKTFAKKKLIKIQIDKKLQLNEIKIKKKEEKIELLKIKKFNEKKTIILKSPYQILLDTNFLIHCIKKKLSLNLLTTSTFLSNVTLNVPECVFGELEKMKNFLAIKVLKSFNFNKLICDHKGTYVDDCLLNRTKINTCYIVATSDRELRNKLKNQNTPIVFIRGFKFQVEGMFI